MFYQPTSQATGNKKAARYTGGFRKSIVSN